MNRIKHPMELPHGWTIKDHYEDDGGYSHSTLVPPDRLYKLKEIKEKEKNHREGTI